MPGLGLYLYGFARAGRLAGLELSGLEPDEPVVPITVGSVAALCSCVPAEQYEQALASKEPPELAWIVPRACRHDEILQAVLDRSAVLPVRFGALFASAGSVQQLMLHRHDEIIDYLNEMDGKEEWSVKLLANLEAAARDLVETDAALAAIRAGLPATPGARYFAQKKLQERALASVREVLGELLCRVAQALDEPGWQICRLPAPSRPSHEELIEYAHFAALVPRAERDELQQRLSALVEPSLAQSVQLVCAGPWPPFHFCPALDRSD